MSDRHTEDGMGFAGHAPSREDHLERRQTQKIVALANECDRLRALNEELVGALVQVRARFQHFNLGPDEAATMKRVNDAIARAKGGPDAR